jgi:hypothetical protein
MSRHTLSLAFACLFLPTSAPADTWHREYAIQGRPELRVSTGDAHVTVESWDKKSIDIQITTTDWKIGPGGLEVSDYQSGDAVELTVRQRPQVVFFGVVDRRADVLVRMPREARLEVRTRDGRLSVRGIQGDLRLQTGDGRLEARDVAGSLEAATGDGSMSVEGRFDDLNARTGDGRMEITVQPGSRMVRSWSLRSGDGSIGLRLPRDFAATLEARSGDGHVEITLPLTLSGRKSRSSVRGTLNGGGHNLILRAGDGSIRVTP